MRMPRVGISSTDYRPLGLLIYMYVFIVLVDSMSALYHTSSVYKYYAYEYACIRRS